MGGIERGAQDGDSIDHPPGAHDDLANVAEAELSGSAPCSLPPRLAVSNSCSLHPKSPIKCLFVDRLEAAFGQCSFRTMNLQQHCIRDEGIADPACHHDDGSCLLCLTNQVVDIEPSNRARRGEIPQRLDHRTQFRIIACLAFAFRLAFCLGIETLKRLVYDLAALVADHYAARC